MFVYELDIRNLKELWYFFRRNKACPRCKGKIYRVDVLPEHSTGWERDGLKFEYAYTVKDWMQYRCDPCHAYYSLQELAAGPN